VKPFVTNWTWRRKHFSLSRPGCDEANKGPKDVCTSRLRLGATQAVGVASAVEMQQGERVVPIGLEVISTSVVAPASSAFAVPLALSAVAG
jgi:hypothetical protein